MKHIADQRLVHGDLAARNLVVTSSLTVKISSPSICYPLTTAPTGSIGTVSTSSYCESSSSGYSDVASPEYYLHPGSRRPVPLRWTAPELAAALQLHSPVQNCSTSMSGDVWSFGVVIWEMFAAGCPLPLSDRTDEQVLSGLEALSSNSKVTGGGSGGLWLRRPLTCPDYVWSLADRCLDPIAVRRPSFVDIVAELDSVNLIDDSCV